MFLWMVAIGPLTCQVNSFLTTYSDEDKSWYVTDAVETSMGDFILCAYDDWDVGSMILKLSSEGEIVSQAIVAATDTTLHACRLLTIPENRDEFILLCCCHPDDGSKAALLLVRVDEDLNVIFRRTIPCPFLDEGDRFFSAKFLLSDEHVFAALSSRPSNLPSLNAIFLAKFDLEGNLLKSQACVRDSLKSVCNLFHDEEDRIGLFGRFGPSHMGFLTFDQSLNLISRDSIFQWSSPEGGVGDYCLYSIMDVINSQAAMLPNGSYMVSSRLFESMHHANGYSYADDRSVIFAKYENDFHQPECMLVTEHMNDSLEYPAFYRSMDFRETAEGECEVYQCAILNERPGFGLLQPYPTGIVVTKTDQDLNVGWKKRFLRDGNYQAMAINATADGGCLVVGSLGDYQAQRFDVFALKINADGAVGVDEVKEENQVFVYPNPSKGVVRIGGVEAKETRVYNAFGQCVMAFHGNEASVATIAAGVYLLKVTDGKGITQTIRFVVEE